MLKYETPSWFYGEKRIGYRIHEVSVCPWTLPRWDVCSCGWYKLYSGKCCSGKKQVSRWRKHGPKDIWFDNCAICWWRITGYPMTFPLAIKHRFQWHALLSLYGHETSFIHIMQHYHALDIRVLTVIPKVPLWKRRSREARQRRAFLLVETKNGNCKTGACRHFMCQRTTEQTILQKKWLMHLRHGALMWQSRFVLQETVQAIWFVQLHVA